MTAEATYGRYREGGGALSEAEFRAALPRALACVEYIVGGNEVTDEGAYLRAVFAALEEYAAANAGGAGFAIGGFRMDAGPSSRAAAGNARAAAYQVLATTGMAYGGLA